MLCHFLITYRINNILQEFKAEISLLKSKTAALIEEVKYKTTQVFKNIFAKCVDLLMSHCVNM